MLHTEHTTEFDKIKVPQKYPIITVEWTVETIKLRNGPCTVKRDIDLKISYKWATCY